MPQSISGVYIIQCAMNGRRYIGSSKDIRRRWREHRNDLRRGDHAARRMQGDWNAFGESAFTFETLLVVANGPMRLAVEEWLIACGRTIAEGYNTAPRTSGTGGTKRTLAQVVRMRASWTPERRQKIADTHRGSKNSHSRLSDEDARDIRRRLATGERGVALATEFGVSQAAISAIRLGKARRDGFDPAQIVDHHGVCVAKLTEQQVREIREHLGRGLTGVAVAAMFGVSDGTVSLIRNRRIWQHVI